MDLIMQWFIVDRTNAAYSNLFYSVLCNLYTVAYIFGFSCVQIYSL